MAKKKRRSTGGPTGAEKQEARQRRLEEKRAARAEAAERQRKQAQRERMVRFALLGLIVIGCSGAFRHELRGTSLGLLCLFGFLGLFGLLRFFWMGFPPELFLFLTLLRLALLVAKSLISHVLSLPLNATGKSVGVWRPRAPA